jgi:hypothetical protein
MKNRFLKACLCALLAISLMLMSVKLPSAQAQEAAVPWSTWERLDVASISDDNSGSQVSTATLESKTVLKVQPGGSAAETKLAIPLKGADLADFATYKRLELEIFLPEENTLNPNKFFLGMADVTDDGFDWKGGVFSASQAKSGWNRIVYELETTMREVPSERAFKLFFSFFHEGADGKLPLTEPFYLGSAFLSATEPLTPPAEAAPMIRTWAAWESKEIDRIGDDNSGSEVSAAEHAGKIALLVMPSGEADETKLAVPLKGADLSEWATAEQLLLEVALPERNQLNPNKFFMGMADVTNGEFNWIAGVFGTLEESTAWSIVRYPIDPAMQKLIADHEYMLFFSFFHEGASGKQALSEGFYLGAINLVERPTPALTPSLWQVWEVFNSGMFGDDNTGTRIVRSDDLRTPNGSPTLKIVPSGNADETKLSYPVSGNNLQVWLTYGQLELEVYLPEENTLNPNTFFLGLAEITTEWRWAGGLFGVPSGDRGWIRVVFPVNTVFRQLNANGAYLMYISSFHQDANRDKRMLNEPFYLGSIHLVPAEKPALSESAQETEADDTYRQEVAILLNMDDETLIDAIARETFDYFWFEVNPANGLIKDRSTPDSVSSIAAVGFGLAALPIGIDRGWISYEEGYQRALITLKTFTSGGAQGERGFFYHFLNMENGARAWSSELSSIDTALLVAGALVAGQYFAGTEVQQLADQLYANVEWDWMLGGGELLKMGWKPGSGFLNASWDHFDESLIMYVLAIGSPTHPIPAHVWEKWDRPVNITEGYVYLPGEPLFVYQYPLAFLDLRGKEDAYVNYWNNAIKACRRNRQFTIDHSEKYSTYRNGVWGLSASDGPFGYRAYGAAGINHDGTIAPYASVACLPMTPDIAFEGIRAMLREFGTQVWREYGFVSAINKDEEWYSREHIGIDQGDILLMIANYQDGFVWRLFMANPHIQKALEAMGFRESQGDYAVTPAYLNQLKGR